MLLTVIISIALGAVTNAQDGKFEKQYNEITNPNIHVRTVHTWLVPRQQLNVYKPDGQNTITKYMYCRLNFMDKSLIRVLRFDGKRDIC